MEVVSSLADEGHKQIFPQEITDYIIDQLGISLINDWENKHSDTATLAACSLVCRAWLPRSSRHLFHAVDLNSKFQWQGDKRTWGNQSLQSFLALARTSTRIASNVVTLVAFFLPSPDNISAIVQTFPRLLSLNWIYDWPVPDARNDVPPPGLELTCLRFNIPHLRLDARARSAVHCLTQFEHICTLDLGALSDEVVPWPRTHRLLLSTLVIESCDICAFNRELAGFFAPTSLRKLVVHCLRGATFEMRDVNLCLQQVATRIEHLTLFTNLHAIVPGAYHEWPTSASCSMLTMLLLEFLEVMLHEPLQLGPCVELKTIQIWCGSLEVREFRQLVALHR